MVASRLRTPRRTHSGTGRASSLSLGGERMTHEFHLDQNVDGFFREIVEDAAEREAVESTDLGLAYVTSLLTSYVRLGHEDRRLLGESVTLALHRAALASGAERFERLRAVG